VENAGITNNRTRHAAKQREIIDPQGEIEGFDDQIVDHILGLQLKNLRRFFGTALLLLCA